MKFHVLLKVSVIAGCMLTVSSSSNINDTEAPDGNRQDISPYTAPTSPPTSTISCLEEEGSSTSFTYPYIPTMVSGVKNITIAIPCLYYRDMNDSTSTLVSRSVSIGAKMKNTSHVNELTTSITLKCNSTMIFDSACMRVKINGMDELGSHNTTAPFNHADNEISAITDDIEEYGPLRVNRIIRENGTLCTYILHSPSDTDDVNEMIQRVNFSGSNELEFHGWRVLGLWGIICLVDTIFNFNRHVL
ncbi:uncharacterized protein VTP21DRAFT_11514 [Calcarisporiella thermophila]|uniref:uncharacterized protein n=1 Tax=Calcarisporiella thermophila TaxID=911321 RepID=UPI003742AD8A